MYRGSQNSWQSFLIQTVDKNKDDDIIITSTTEKYQGKY